MNESGGVPPQAWERLADMQKRITDVQRRTADAELVLHDKQRQVTIMVGQGGRLKEIDITDEAMDELTAEELCNRIMDQYEQATAEMEARTLTDMKESLGIAFTPGQVNRGEVDPADLAARLRRDFLGR